MMKGTQIRDTQTIPRKAGSAKKNILLLIFRVDQQYIMTMMAVMHRELTILCGPQI